MTEQLNFQGDSSNRLPPQNVEAEEAILGGILLDPEAIGRVSDFLIPQAFYISAHKDIYQAALRLFSQGKPTDLLTVTSWLTDHDLLVRVGGRNKLATLVDRTVSAVNIDALAGLVMDKYLRRQLIKAGNEIVHLGYETETELPKILDQSEQKVFRLSHHSFGSNTEHNSTINITAYEDLNSGNPIYPTGINELDNLMLGFEGGTLTLVAGRPSMGKSQIALFLAFQMILLHDLPVVIFSLEMTKKQLEYRLWSLISVTNAYKHLGLTPLRSDRIRRHRSGNQPLEDWEYKSIAKIVGIASELPLYMNDSRGITVSGIASECRQIKAKEGKLGLVIVDYLQMMAEDSGGNRSYELGDVARGLYKMAGDLNVPVLALSQISRGVESRQNKRPMMSDLSQSGILEMVADNIILAYRDEYYNPDTEDQGILELIMAKSRHGDTGTATVFFDKSYGIIRNLG
ncbi:replicative DNA helicase [Fischerella thermalis]|uniref:replicative DNA helicase n=1 Tax=Fischerella thermalis TaxID=372787 RepID=UPI000C807466|nr:replicative DNA helicase [Fischerella thermalis]MBF1990816.1 replicative DNA helicase [Fischerella thermalis M58_A2018_009]MBF2061290.1 replicative DNA helicase [Fischerella thermalis M66_A2018_004]PLZ91805.1 replicative DNA helicase [Fischerella thermalis CCMEE 5194]